MAETKVITFGEIREAWKQYITGQLLEVLAKGEKIYLPLGSKMPDGATSAAVVPMRKGYTFPDYLEKVVWNKKSS